MIRPARFGNEVLEIADLLLFRSRKKTSIEVCRSRVTSCVKKAKIKKRNTFAAALVSESKAGKVDGFLYAEERAAFDLCFGIAFVEVLFLIGGAGVSRNLLRDLRGRTAKRILLQSWAMLGKIDVFERLVRPLKAQEVGRIYQI